MKYFMLVVISGLVVACASPSSVRQKSPTVSATSTHPAKRVAGCIADRWESANHKPPITSRPTSNGYALMAESDLGMYGKDTSFIIDVDDVPPGSRTVFYSNIALSSGTDLVGSIVRACQN